MAQLEGDMDYLIQDENGQIIKIIRPSEIKSESTMSTAASAVYVQHTESMSTSQYARLQNVYSSGARSGSSAIRASTSKLSATNVKYEAKYHSSEMLIQTETKPTTYIMQHSQGHSAKGGYSKSERNSSTHNTVQSSISKRRRSDKVGKGLRHFSMKVCEKVKEKGSTTYNEVADELVAEEVQNCESYDSSNCDQKNIRRRVYDALNVLMAMNIILKDKKDIRWIGLPTNSVQQCNTLEKDNQKRRERIEAKQQQLKELILQQVALKNLIERNKEAEREGIIPTANSSIQLPFIIVNTHKATKINCSVSADKSEYYFKFNDKFEIHDDVEVLKRMGLLLGLDKGECTFDDIERAKLLVPKNFDKYIEIYGRGLDETANGDDYDMSSIIEMVDPLTTSQHATDQSSEHYEIEEEILSENGSDLE